jgi:MFS transporter, DHA1 family, inner membrane transport protein
MGISLFAFSLAGMAFSTPTQLRILNAAKAAPNLASTLISTAYNVGIAGGAFLGAMLLNSGLSYTTLPLVGIVCSTTAALIAAGSWQAERRRFALA